MLLLKVVSEDLLQVSQGVLVVPWLVTANPKWHVTFSPLCIHMCNYPIIRRTAVILGEGPTRLQDDLV